MSAYFELQGNEFSNVIETKSHVLVPRSEDFCRKILTAASFNWLPVKCEHLY